MKKSMWFALLNSIVILSNVNLVAGSPITDLADPVGTTPANTGTPDRRIILNFDDMDTDVLKELEKNNLTINGLRQQQESLKATFRQQVTAAGPPVPMTMNDGNTGEEPNFSQNVRRNWEEYVIGNIKQTIESNVMRNETTNQLGVTHEIAFQPVCDIPKNASMNFWFDTDTLNLFFRLPIKKMIVNSAILRLYKINPNATDNRNATEGSDCTDQTDKLLRITVFVYTRKNPEWKKKLCSSKSVPRTYQGWVEMDIKLAVKQWEKPNRNLGLAIDVQDQDENYVNAKSYFHLQCIEASSKRYPTISPTLPWNYYWDQSNGSSFEMDRVPHHPRLDIIYRKDSNYHYYHRRLARQSNQRENDTSSTSSSSSSSASSEHIQASATTTLAAAGENTVNHHSQGQKRHKKRHLQHKFQHNLHNKQHKSSSELSYTL